MKKSISLLLTILLLASLAGAAYAEDGTSVESYGEIGLTLYLPESFSGLRGVYYPYAYGEIISGSDLYAGEFLYFGIPAEEFWDLVNKDSLTDEESALLSARQLSLGSLLVIGGKLSFEEAKTLLGFDGEDSVELLAEAEGYGFYKLDWAEEENAEALPADFAEEYRALRQAFSDALKTADYYAPVLPEDAMVGRTLHFETTDLDGNPVDTAALFAEHAYTLLNVWATWCPPCVGELGELDAINERLAELDCAVVGLLHDGGETGKAELGKSLMEEHGAHYPVLLPPENLDELIELTAFPTSYIVDRSGTVAAAPIVGAYTSRYEEAIAELLADISAGPVAAANDAGVYRVFVTDGAGEPLQDVLVQLCSDAACITARTDAAGAAVFETAEGAYTVHILKAPAGFAVPEDDFPMPEVYSDLTVVLETAEQGIG